MYDVFVFDMIYLEVVNIVVVDKYIIILIDDMIEILVNFNSSMIFNSMMVGKGVVFVKVSVVVVILFVNYGV